MSVRLSEQVEWSEERAGLAYKRVTTLTPSGLITYAALPASEKIGNNLLLWYDFKNTGTETANFRPCMDIIGYATGHCFSSRTLEPGQSISDLYGQPTFLACLSAWWKSPVTRVDLRVEVETPEGWVEIDRRTGPPFEKSTTYLMPELVNVTAPAIADQGTEVTVEITGLNPGYTNPSTLYFYVNEKSGGYVSFPIIGQDTVFNYVFFMPSSDVTLKIQLARYSLDGPLLSPAYRTVTILVGEVIPPEPEGKAQIRHVTLPEVLNPGDTIKGFVVIKNIGTVSDRIRCCLITEWNGKSYSGEVNAVPGGVYSFRFSSELMIIMPEVDAVLTISGQHREDSTWITDDIKTVTILTEAPPPPPEECSVLFTVVDALGNPLEGATLNMNGLSGVTDYQGTILFTDLALKTYGWSVSLAGYVAQSGQIQCTEAVTYGIQVTLIAVTPPPPPPPVD